MGKEIQRLKSISNLAADLYTRIVRDSYFAIEADLDESNLDEIFAFCTWAAEGYAARISEYLNEKLDEAKKKGQEQ